MQMAAFVQIALAFLQGGAAEVRRAAAEAVLALLRHCPQQAQRTQIYNQLMATYAASVSYSDRIIFLEVCALASAYFSHRCVLSSWQFLLYL